jgi:hypothetical protein
MEVPQRKSLCIYAKHPKMSFFSFFFSYTKSENNRVEQVLSGMWGNGKVG